jgi:diguanylate cyclase (GGDEF)-like protein
MDGISVIRAAAIPALGLVISVGVAVASVGAASSIRTDRSKLDASRKQVSMIEPIHRIRLAGFEAYAQYWNRELGQRSEIAGSTAALRRAIANPALNDEPSIVEGRKRLTSLQAATTTKQQMGMLGEVSERTETAAADVLKPLAAQTGDLGSAVTALWKLHGMSEMITHYRVAREVDPRPTSADVRAYIAGGIAGDEVDATRTFQTELLDGVKDSVVRRELESVARLPETKAFLDEANWSLRGGQTTSHHPTFAELDKSRQTVMAAVGRVYTHETGRIDQQLQSDLRTLQADYSRSRKIGWGALAGVIGSLLWLFGRLGSRLRAMRTLAETDSLTKALNRNGVRRVVEPWFSDRGSKPIALAVIDLDQFKSINDSYGHSGGDCILSAVSKSLHGTTIPDQTSIGRWGGDEFVAVFRLPQDSAASSFDGLFERVHSSIATPILVREELVTATATMGVVVCSCGSCDFDDLFRVADHALYVGKFDGRNRWTSVGCEFDLSQRITKQALSPNLPVSV